ncbi:MAG: hypothetical protein MUF58_03115 [Arcicella sp.]|jgi:hypothetical protein|nr:hypothetical protein [Arcicella sp.]
MLSEEDKIDFLEEYLNLKNGSYGDNMKEELIFYFFELENDKSFLDHLDSEDAIKSKVEILISKMILHEHEDGLHNIIENYI